MTTEKKIAELHLVSMILLSQPLEGNSDYEKLKRLEAKALAIVCNSFEQGREYGKRERDGELIIKSIGNE